MIHLVFLLLILIPSYGFGSCESLLVEKNLRIELSHNEIILAPVTHDHIGNLQTLFLNPGVNRFFLGGGDSLELAEAHVRRAQNPLSNTRDKFDGLWMIKYNNNTVGFIMISAIGEDWIPSDARGSFNKNNENDLYLATGYALFPEYEGNGIASRALKLVMDYAEHQLKAIYIFASTSYENHGSIQLLERNLFLPLSSELSKSAKFYKKLN